MYELLKALNELSQYDDLPTYMKDGKRYYCRADSRVLAVAEMLSDKILPCTNISTNFEVIRKLKNLGYDVYPQGQNMFGWSNGCITGKNLTAIIVFYG